MLSDVEAELTGNRFNDGKCDPNGNLWVGSMHLEQSAPKASLYKIDAKGTATKMLDSVTISNGIVWTSDNKTMYYIDTKRGNVRAYDYDKSSGDITNERVVITVSDTLGYPDGMTIDAEGMLWIALWNGNCISRWNPNTGEKINEIKLPHEISGNLIVFRTYDKLTCTNL